MSDPNKVVLVAGAGSSAPGWSIGKATSVLIAQSGAKVIALDCHADAARATALEIERIGGTCLPVQGDITRPDEMDRVLKTATERFGPISTLIANAGIGKTGGIQETSVADLQRIQQTNVESLLLLSKRLIPGMIERGAGCIVSVASVAGIRYVGYPHLAYSVTKAALIQMTKLIAHEYADRNIRANTVIPGLIDTPRIQKNVAAAFSSSSDMDEVREKRNAQVPMKRMGTAWEVAHAIAFLASDQASYITGTELIVDGGLTGKY
jgi:NAD(P)-dependent dehydrogenase (short-subunit alcohol dehydrogenase family)